MNKIERHQALLNYLHNLYITKNHDYGDSVHDTYLKYGITSFFFFFFFNMNRVRTLSQKDGLVNDEKIQDTLSDLATDSILAVLELEGENN